MESNMAKNKYFQQLKQNAAAYKSETNIANRSNLAPQMQRQTKPIYKPYEAAKPLQAPKPAGYVQPKSPASGGPAPAVPPMKPIKPK